MRLRLQCVSAVIAAAAAAPLARAQSFMIDPAHKFAWNENAGFLNWADAGAPTSPLGARYFSRSSGGFFKGFVWSENTGWINLGNGAGPYANTLGQNSGVNADSAGNLSGLAWGENAGWINFNTASSGNRARIDWTSPSGPRLRGYAWNENFGWINLDNASIFVALDPGCPADLNRDGMVDDADFVAFLPAYSLVECTGPGAPFGCPSDLNGDGFVDDADFQVFIVGYNQLLCG